MEREVEGTFFRLALDFLSSKALFQYSPNDEDRSKRILSRHRLHDTEGEINTIEFLWLGPFLQVIGSIDDII